MRHFGAGSAALGVHRFVEALTAGVLLPATLFNEAIRPHHEFMGLGFFATEHGPGYPERNFRWGHAGSADGTCADVRTYPVTGETVISLSDTDIPGCFELTDSLHRQWEIRRMQSVPVALEAHAGAESAN